MPQTQSTKLALRSPKLPSVDDYLKKHFASLLEEAGVHLNGRKPWDIRVYHPHFYRRVLVWGSLGLGEAYMDGWWEAKAPDEFIYRLLRANIPEKLKARLATRSLETLSRVINMQSLQRSSLVVEKHYDLGNELYRKMLDSRLVYSCGYWKNATTLEEAQLNKLKLVCEKLNLKSGMTVLDIGCGWGGFAKFAAEQYGVHVTGVTNSKEQAKFAKELCQGLKVKIQFKDYREIQGVYDRVASVGMFEHVGYKNYREYMELVSKLVHDDGLFLLHTIGANHSSTTIDAWIHKYIFPNSLLPSAKQIAEGYEGLFVMEDWHNFGADYDKTLMAWYENFMRNWVRPAHEEGERFYRMWSYYLLVSAASFRARNNQLWQIVLSKAGTPGGYTSLR